MIVTQHGQVKIYQFESFDPAVIGHAFFTRLGGVSPEPWSSLNQGGGLGDSRENVIENRKRAFAEVSRTVESIYDVWQVHSADVVVTESPRPLDVEHIKADAIITTKAEVTLFMRFADCVPVLMYDPGKRIIATVHAGWQGTVKKVVEKTIERLQQQFAVDPGDLVAGIGPSIGPCHYQVGEEVVQAVKQAFTGMGDNFIRDENGQHFFDLWKCNEHQLRSGGVRTIEIAGICTACHMEHWFSHRGEHGKTGRFGAALFLQE
jgi:YfiH family protein